MNKHYFKSKQLLTAQSLNELEHGFWTMVPKRQSKPLVLEYNAEAAAYTGKIPLEATDLFYYNKIIGVNFNGINYPCTPVGLEDITGPESEGAMLGNIKAMLNQLVEEGVYDTGDDLEQFWRNIGLEYNNTAIVSDSNIPFLILLSKTDQSLYVLSVENNKFIDCLPESIPAISLLFCNIKEDTRVDIDLSVGATGRLSGLDPMLIFGSFPIADCKHIDSESLDSKGQSTLQLTDSMIPALPEGYTKEDWCEIEYLQLYTAKDKRTYELLVEQEWRAAIAHNGTCKILCASV